MKSQIKESGRFVIGLTGAIGTGKSLVRKLLEHKGALTIDADLLAHSAYTKGTEGYTAIIRRFGDSILAANGQIDRQRLGGLVFGSQDSLAELEAIIHPLVSQAIEKLMVLSPLPIIVIEAIKLLESDLKEKCDTVWMATSTIDDIYQRLGSSRGMTPVQVDERLGSQSALISGERQVDTTISNQGNFENLLINVNNGWNTLTEKYEAFYTALSQTQVTLQSFQENLIEPDEENQTRALSEIDFMDQVYVPVDILSTETPQESFSNLMFSSMKSDPYHFFIWKSPVDQSQSQYMISNMENFSAAASSGASSWNADQLTRMVNMVESFSSLHLCETLFLPFNKENTLLGIELGFNQWINDPTSDANFNLLGYNLLSKQLRPKLALFREK